MGNVDTIRQVIHEAMAKRGRDIGPGSLLWFVLLDYLLVQAFCHYQHAKVEHKLGKFVSMKQFQEARRKNNSFEKASEATHAGGHRGIFSRIAPTN